MTVVLYTYDADYHCPEHAAKRFGPALHDGTAIDDEGNPIGAVFAWEYHDDDVCSECTAIIIAERIAAAAK